MWKISLTPELPADSQLLCSLTDWTFTELHYYPYPAACACVCARMWERENWFLILLWMRSDLSPLTLDSHSHSTPHTHTHRCATGNQWNYEDWKQQYPGEQSRDLQTKEDLQLNFFKISLQDLCSGPQCNWIRQLHQDYQDPVLILFIQ